MRELNFIATKDGDLLSFLQSFYLSKKTINEFIYHGHVAINGLETKNNEFYKQGNLITITYYEETNIKPYFFLLVIVFEDDDLLIVNKPTNLLVHPDDNSEKTLDNIVYAYFINKNNPINPRHLHRLDTDTSGLVIYAKHLLAHAFLNYQIENNLVEKKYYAIVEGTLKQKQGTIDLPIGRNRHEANKSIVSKQGKRAITEFKVIKEQNKQSLLDVTIHTGRTHQIRVHLAHLDHPVVGDKLYGTQAERLMLHAYYLAFIHPRTKKKTFIQIDIPSDFTLKNEKS
ncbi:MAG: RluA family pseudouridine synthase [Bacilli bacterium]